MKKSCVFLGVALGIVVLLVGNIQAQSKFSIKIKGGYSQISFDDLNSIITSHDMLFEDLSVTLGMAKEGRFEKMSGGLDFEGEIMMKLTQKIGIGFGLGYIQSQKDCSTTLSFKPLYRLETDMKLKMSALPIKLSVFYFFPVTPGLNLYLNGGLGCYFGNMSYSIYMDEEILDFSSSSQADGNVEDRGIGYHGGLGLEMKLADTVVVFLDVGGRHVKFNNWKGKESSFNSEGLRESRSGTLWYYETFEPDFQKYYSDLSLSENQPEVSGIQNVRKLEVNLSGLSLRLGVRILF